MNEQFDLFIDGAWRPGGSGAVTEVVNPADESVIGTLPHASASDLDAAVQAASAAFPGWRDTPVEERAAVLRRAADLLVERVDAIAAVMTREQGKTIGESRGEVERSAMTIRWFADEAERIVGREIPGDLPGSVKVVTPEPVGVAVAFTAWNFPAILPARKVAPALGAGCTVILKAAEETPGTAVEIVKAFHDAGLPPGALNLVYGVPSDISEHLLGSPEVRKVSFTGSVRVGKLLAGLAAEHLTRLTLELGGHAPTIVFRDADLDKVLPAASIFKWRNAGQVCLTPSRFYVHEDRYDEFVERFVTLTNQVKVGNGADDGVDMGPLNNRRRLEATERLVADARDRGAQVLTGGDRIGDRGWFYSPTVLVDVPEEAAMMNEEPFGPVAPILSFSTTNEVIARSNRLRYGLAAYLFTESDDLAEKVTRDLEVGGVGVNMFAPAPADAPFGGVKDSGFGLEGGREGLEAFLQMKLVQRAD